MFKVPSEEEEEVQGVGWGLPVGSSHGWDLVVGCCQDGWDVLGDGLGWEPHGHPQDRPQPLFEFPVCEAVALADATPVAAADPSAKTEAELYGMSWVFTSGAGPVKEGEGAASTEAKLIGWAAGEPAARAAKPARRKAWRILNDGENKWKKDEDRFLRGKDGLGYGIYIWGKHTCGEFVRCF